MLKRFGLGSTIIILSLPIFFLGETLRDRQKPVDVRFVISSRPTSYLLQAVHAKGIFKKHGLQVDIIDTGSNYEQAVDNVRQGMADGGIFSLSEPLLLTAEGVPMKVVASIDYSAGADGIVATSDIRSLADLRGRRVAVQKQGLSRFLLQEALRRAALSEADLDIVSEEPLSAVRSFIGNKVDAVVAFEPFLNLAETRRNSHVLFSSAETPGLISDVIVFRAEYVVAHPAEVAAFLRAWFDVIDYLQKGEAERQEVMAFVAIASGVTLNDVEREFDGIKLLDFAANAVAFTNSSDITSLYGSGTRFLEYLELTRKISEPIVLTNVLDSRFIRRGLRWD
jgi:NitT/TauT family transport system substrate-binding protein